MYQRYIELKTKGTVSIREGSDKLELVTKRFDQDTGEEVEEKVEQVLIPDLEKEKAILLRELDNVNALIEDAQAVKAL